MSKGPPIFCKMKNEYKASFHSALCQDIFLNGFFWNLPYPANSKSLNTALVQQFISTVSTDEKGFCYIRNAHDVFILIVVDIMDGAGDEETAEKV